MTIYRALLAISTTILIKKVLKTSQLPSIASLLIVMYLFCKSAHKSETFLHTPEMSILILIEIIINKSHHHQLYNITNVFLKLLQTKSVRK